MNRAAVSLAVVTLTTLVANAQLRSPSIEDATTLVASIWSYNSVCSVIYPRISDQIITTAGVKAGTKLGLDMMNLDIRDIARRKTAAMYRGIVFMNDQERRAWCDDIKAIIDKVY